MRLAAQWLAILVLVGGACFNARSAQAEHVWVVQLDTGGEIAAREIADDHGLEYHGRVPHLRNKFVFRLSGNNDQDDSDDQDPELPGFSRRRRSVREVRDVFHRSLELNPKVSWISYQQGLKRQKRDFMPLDEVGQAPDSREASSSRKFRSIPQPPPPPSGLGSRAVSDFSPSELNRHADRIFRDPLWPKQWYLHDTRTSPKQPKVDFHVIPAWRRNLTGRGVVVAVLDDGLERDHPDLAANYDARASYNYNANTPDPLPRYVNVEDERHGTRCAGEIAMSANNSHCGVGVAFNARIGGVKILDGRVSAAASAGM